MLNISSHICVGYQSSTYDLPEAEIIPFGNSPAERKKLEKLTTDSLSVVELENTPLPGFTFMAVNKKTWGAVEPTWLVIDPRGFMLRITLANVNKLLMNSNTSAGLIQEKCIWARDNNSSAMELISINSSEYNLAVENTQLLVEKIDIKSVGIGDLVIMNDNIVGTYMGVVSFYGPMIPTRTDMKSYQPQCYLRRQVVKLKNGRYYHKTNLNILKILQKSSEALTREDSVAEMNDAISKGIAIFTLYPTSRIIYNTLCGAIEHVSTTATHNVKLTYEEITKDDALVLFKKSQPLSDQCKLLAEDKFKNKVALSWPYRLMNAQPKVLFKNATSLDDSSICLTDLGKTQNISTYDVNLVDFDNFVKYYKIVKHVKNGTYI